jgi:hypothetical protein
MPFGGVVVNRFHDTSGGGKSVDPKAELGPELAARVESNYAAFSVLTERDRVNLKRLTERLSGEPVVVVPEFDGDVHDLDGLAAMVAHLYR